jgi:septal ring factor EnvC (AmiA/AmiB activator)
MAKAATKKNPKTSKMSTPKKAPAAKSSRVTPAKLIKAAKAPVAKKVVAKASVPSKKTRAARAPVITKDELRNQIEKLTAANTTLKTKGRETAKALKAAEARIAVLEHQINQTDTKAVIEEKPTQAVKLPRKRRTPKTGAQPAPEAEGGEDTEGPLDSETV